LMVTTATETHFVGHDGNGNVSVMADGTTAAVTANYEYSPFGQVIRASGAMALVNPIRFSSKYQDEESGYNYYGLRFYNPDTGRWLNRDPIGENGGANVYGFVGNDSVNRVDLLGMLDLIIMESGLAIHDHIGDYLGYELVDTTGHYDAMTALAAIVGFETLIWHDPSMTREGKTLGGTVRLKDMPNRNNVSTLAHELVHVFQFKFPDRYPPLAAPSLAEGEAYAFEALLDTVFHLRLMEQSLTWNPCEFANSGNLESRWQDFWGNHGIANKRGKVHWTEIQFWAPISVPKSRDLDPGDFAEVERNFGFKLKCSRIAEIVNRILEDNNCGCPMIKVTCQETSGLSNEIPAGVAIDAIFR